MRNIAPSAPYQESFCGEKAHPSYNIPVVMPGLLTHYCFAKYVAQRDEPLILVGTQGPDIFFSYGLTLKKKRKNTSLVHKFGSNMHFVDPSAAYYDFILLAKDSEHRELLSTYIDGILMHYALDSVAHAYVFCRSGWSKEKGKWLAYSCAHNYFETLLDKEVMKHFADDTKPHKVLPLSKEEASIISSYWCKLNEKHHIIEGELAPDGFSGGLEDYRFVERFLLSKAGIKRCFFRLFGKKKNKLFCYCYPRNTKEGEKYDLLNLKKSLWVNPVTEEEHHETMFEMMDIAYKKYLALKEIKEKALDGEEVYEDFEKVVNGYNHDGVPASNREMKHFIFAFDWGK